jgi:hypothetical protein
VRVGSIPAFSLFIPSGFRFITSAKSTAPALRLCYRVELAFENQPNRTGAKAFAEIPGPFGVSLLPADLER